MGIRIQAIPTWICNLYDFKKAGAYGKNCAYCNLYSPMQKGPSFVTFGPKLLPLDREMVPEEWAAGSRKVFEAISEPILFDFTGGEPTLYWGLPELLHLVKEYSEWAITSNSLLRAQIEAIFEADAKLCRSWTASWHPGAQKPIDAFLDNLKFIQSHGVYTSCTIVLHSTTKKTIKDDLKRIQDAGITTQIHLYLAPGYALANDEDKEIHALYEELKGINRAPAESFDEDLPELRGPKTCIAGFRSAAVSSDGAVFGCYRGLMTEPDPPIGRWGEWTPRADMTRGCEWACTFACDVRNTISKYYVAA